MFFLLNDVILNLDPQTLSPPLEARQFMAIKLDTVSSLGAELYSADPLLHQNNPDRARRLVALIVAKAPDVNAALFVAPARGCPTSQVACRFAQIGFDVMGGLYARQQQGGLSTVQADKEVWRRLAA
jgi:hypothetical protein